jgi:hypothetical protein
MKVSNISSSAVSNSPATRKTTTSKRRAGHFDERVVHLQKMGEADEAPQFAQERDQLVSRKSHV